MVEYVPHAILQLTGSHTDATTESCTYMPKTSAVDFGPHSHDSFARALSAEKRQCPGGEVTALQLIKKARQFSQRKIALSVHLKPGVPSSICSVWSGNRSCVASALQAMKAERSIDGFVVVLGHGFVQQIAGRPGMC